MVSRIYIIPVLVVVVVAVVVVLLLRLLHCEREERYFKYWSNWSYWMWSSSNENREEIYFYIKRNKTIFIPELDSNLNEGDQHFPSFPYPEKSLTFAKVSDIAIYKVRKVFGKFSLHIKSFYI